MSDQNGFGHPTEKMAGGEHVQMRPELFDADVRTVYAVLFVHVDSKIFKTGIEPQGHPFDGLVFLKQQKQQRQRVQDAQPENHPPDGRVGPDERPVGKRQQRHEHQKEYDAPYSGAYVAVDGFIVSDEGHENNAGDGQYQQSDGMRFVEKL